METVRTLDFVGRSDRAHWCFLYRYLFLISSSDIRVISFLKSFPGLCFDLFFISSSLNGSSTSESSCFDLFFLEPALSLSLLSFSESSAEYCCSSSSSEETRTFSSAGFLIWKIENFIEEFESLVVFWFVHLHNDIMNSPWFK